MTEFASCCVLSFERPAFLRTAIATLIENAHAPLELLIHDDGSKDREVYSVLDDARRQHGATIITNAPGHNQGQGTALNRMFSMAKGDPIIKIDQDLIFHDGWLARAVELFDWNRRHAYTSSEGRKCQGWEPPLGLLGLLHYHHDPVASIKCKLEQHAGWQSHTHLLGSGFAVKRNCWCKLGPFTEHNTAFTEDWLFQRKVTDSPSWVCGLPDEDLVTNQGMGIGPSTVVVAPGQVREIHTGPYVISPE